MVALSPTLFATGTLPPTTVPNTPINNPDAFAANPSLGGSSTFLGALGNIVLGVGQGFGQIELAKQAQRAGLTPNQATATNTATTATPTSVMAGTTFGVSNQKLIFGGVAAASVLALVLLLRK